jgi:NADPH2:quinone reductase
MRAVICRELGPPSLLAVEEREDPTAADHQVVVAVEAAGVNFVDGLFIAGQYQIKPPLPFTPGSEIAGRVASIGEGVEDYQVGQRVMATTGLGGYASHVVVPAVSLATLPDGLDAPRAATFTQSFSTCLFALRDRAHVEPGQSVLVLGAGGGIGLAAIAVARTLGCRVLAAASSEEKRAAALGAGADDVIDTSSESTESIKDRARQWAGGTGVDVVVDPIGGPAAEQSLRALGDAGRYLVIGFASGSIPSVPLNQVLLRNRSVLGIDWGIWSMQHGMEQMALLRDLLVMVAAGDLDPTQATTYPLDQVAAALDDLLARRVVGKIALIP